MVDISLAPLDARTEATVFNDPNFLTWTVSLSEASLDEVSVDYRLLAGTAQAGGPGGVDDVYGATPATLVFAPGETSKTISYRIDADSSEEFDEAVIVEIFGARNATLADDAEVLRATGFVLDDDGAGNRVALFTQPVRVVETDAGGSEAIFALNLSRPATQSFSVSYATVDGTAVAGQDYTATSGSETFSVGQQQAFVRVPIIGDGAAEAGEFFTLTVSTPSAVATSAGAIAEILDDDTGGSRPSVNVSPLASDFEGTVFNDPNFVTWTVSLSAPSINEVTVDFRLLSGTAFAGGTDTANDVYGTTPSSLTFAPGETSKTISYRIDADGRDELDEAVVLELFAAENAELAGPGPVVRSTGFVLDDDSGGNKLILFTEPVRIEESDAGSSEAVFTLSLSRPATQSTTVAFQTVDGTALAGEDYAATSGSVVFAEGQQQAVVRVPVFGDAAAEATEFFTLDVTAPAQIAAAADAIAEIVDDDTGGPRPTVNVAPLASDQEGTVFNDPNFLIWTVTLSEPSINEVTVDFRLLSGSAFAGGTDTANDVYGTTPSSLTFAPGETSKTISYRINADGGDELDEAVVLELFAAENAELAGPGPVVRSTGVVLDDDGTGNNLTLFTQPVRVEEGDSGEAEAVFTLTLSRPAPQAITVAYNTIDGTAVAGEDYTATSGTVEFGEGVRQVAVRVPILSDGAAETSEFFTLNVDTPFPLASSADAIAEIVDDDTGGPRPSVNVTPLADDAEATVFNDPNFLIWTVNLSEPAINEVTVDFRLLSGSASAGGTDTANDVYGTTPSSLTFAPGETSKTISYRINADGGDELDEAVVLELFAAENAELAGPGPVLRSTGFVLDDDGTGNNLTLFTEPVRIEEGDDEGVEAVFTLTLSRPAPQAISVAYDTIDGTAFAGEDYAATSGTVEFAEGTRQAVVRVPILSDDVSEASEFFTLNVATPFPLASSADAIAEILDDDTGGPRPSVNVTPLATDDEGTVFNDPNFLTWTLTLSEPSINEVTVDFRILSGTAAAGATDGANDVYGQTPSSLTFTPGETSKTISYRINADGGDETDEAVVLELTGAENADLAGPGDVLRSTGFVRDDDGSGANLALFTQSVRVEEGDGPGTEAVFVLSLSRPAPQAINVAFNTVDGSAVAGQDYVATSGVVAFAEGQEQAVVRVPLIGDNAEEAIETFTLNVATPFPLAAAAGGVAEILNDDRPNTGPSFVTGVDLSVVENTTDVATLDVDDDQDGVGDGLSFSIDGGEDSAAFAIGATSGALRFLSAPDFENLNDADGDGVFEVNVRVEDSDGAPASRLFLVSVTDDVGPGDPNQPSGPTLTGRTSLTVNENISTIVNFGATDDEDSEGDGLTFSIAPGGDGARFAINAATGVLSFRTPPDFENPADIGGDNVYDVTVRVTDSDGFFGDAAVRVEVADVDDQLAPNLPLPGGDPVIPFIENNLFVINLNATDDADGEGDGLTYSISGGADASLFTVNTSGVVTFISAPDFEDPSDTDRDNRYSVEVSVTDRDGLSDSQALTIAVQDEGPTNDDRDQLIGTAGRDLIDGLDGRDRISGLQERDTLFGGAGDDTLRGGIDNDRLRGGDDDDVIRGQGGSDRLFGQSGDDNLIGANGADTLKGGADDDRLVGGGAADRLFGGTGDDTLIGSAGDDRLVGSAGDDLLDGGSGADRFIFRQNIGNDTVQNFEDGVDLIRIQNVASSIADLSITQSGANAVISFQGSTVTLTNFDADDLSGADFLF